jgi:uncharacterized protein YkwD
MRRGIRHAVAGLLVVSALVVPAEGLADGGAAARARAASQRCDATDVMPGQAPADDVRDATLCLMNAERSARGLGKLRAEDTLARVAGRYARQMVRDRFFDHTSPGGTTMLSRIKSSSYLRGVSSWMVGENLAWGSGPLATPKATVQAWMHSAGHRANLLDSDFTEVGIGIAGGAPVDLGGGASGATYVTDFGRRRRG